MGSDERHFNVSLIMRDKVTKQCPQTTTFEEESLPAYRLPLGHILYISPESLGLQCKHVIIDSVHFQPARSTAVSSLICHGVS